MFQAIPPMFSIYHNHRGWLTVEPGLHQAVKWDKDPREAYVFASEALALTVRHRDWLGNDNVNVLTAPPDAIAKKAWVAEHGKHKPMPKPAPRPPVPMRHGKPSFRKIAQ